MDYKGKKVRITGNSTNHMWQKGHIVIIIQEQNNGYDCSCGCGCDDDCNDEYKQYTAKDPKSNQTQTISIADFILLELNEKGIQTIIDEINISISKKEEEIEGWKEKINYINETKSENFNEDEWKAYKVLKTINDDTSDIEKAKIIAKIINN